jgi:hypothetical protein
MKRTKAEKLNRFLPVKVVVFQIYPSKLLPKLSLVSMKTEMSEQCEETREQRLVKIGVYLILLIIKKTSTNKLYEEN